MQGIPAFLRDDRGSQSIEFVLWLPIIGALLTVISYANILYTTHSNMWNVARDTARRMTTGALEVGTPAEDYAQSQLKLYQYFDAGYLVKATKDPVTSTVTVVITLTVTGSSFDTGILEALSLVGGTVAARVVMRSAPA